MRLSKIKLAGFKSFVDPATINLPSSLTGIVGPNGCGKSNTIDAVRWVMGESSAKHLRGDSMEDVIFNGSSSRKPVAQASVELVFDNSDGALGGEYARFNEISIRRQVVRDGTSTYFLNGTRCRRRDITDIFLGTGLGPRSYAIIEQGMISRLIDAKPQELRAYLEEAAGISKYKERRRETENRIRHTRDNLSRLSDLREEIEKQLNHLKRQANTAEKYKTLKTDERRSRAELLVLRLLSMNDDLEQRQSLLKEEETGVEKQLAALRHAEAQIEAFREQRNKANEGFNDVQGRFYKLGGEISRTEQSIQHQRELLERQQQEQAENAEAMQQAEYHIQQDETRLQELQSEATRLEPDFAAAKTCSDAAANKLNEAEQAMSEWQNTWEDYNKRAAEPAQKAQVERARMEQLERQLQQLGQRETRLQQEQKRLSTEQIMGEISQFSTEADQARSQMQQLQTSLDTTLQTIHDKRDGNKQSREQLESLQHEAQKLRGRLASLEALQQAALGKDQQGVRHWLEKQGLSAATRLAEQVKAEPEWSTAVEMVLGNYLEAVNVDSLENHLESLQQFDQGQVLLIEPAEAQTGTVGQTLWSVVDAPESTRGLLESVHIAGTLPAAMALRKNLAAYESVVTPEGIWLGQHWLRISKDVDEHAGVLARKEEINTLTAKLSTLDEQIGTFQSDYEQRREDLKQLEQNRQEQQGSVNQAHRHFAERNAMLSNRQSRHEQIEGRRQAVTKELTDIQGQTESEQTALETATHERNEAIAAMDELAREHESLQQQREKYRQALDTARTEYKQHQDVMHQLTVQMEAQRTAEASTRQNLERMRSQIEHLRGRSESLQQALASGDAPVLNLQSTLGSLLTKRVDEENALSAARDGLQSIDNQLNEQEQLRHKTEEAINEQRQGMESLKMACQEISVRQQTLLEQLAETEYELEVLQTEMPEKANSSEWEQKIERLGQRIQRLGPINLAAIDEFQEQTERKTYLDSQNDDLTEALETLEKAISKIDRETRARFKETFEKVNTRLQEMFPRLFGGGSAHLEMTEDDLLTTGVTVMARPPGKRISNIHLMSGGEKALTAVALVFAIFELNPAPFCMLDEVDAPLDEANVGRFCDLLREMSERVQFIFITHNKTTMELSEHLMGVTMREPGVSRLVDVDVDEAAMMATG